MKRIVLALLSSALLLTAMVGCEHIPDKPKDEFLSSENTIEKHFFESSEIIQEPQKHTPILEINSPNDELRCKQFEELIAPLPVEYQAVLNGEKYYYDTIRKDYRNITNEFQWIAVVDMDGDGIDEVLLQSLILDINLYLHCIGGTVYGYMTSATVTVCEDGSVHWGKTTYKGLEYGANRYTFSETGWEAEQLYLIVNDASENVEYLVGGQCVTKDEFQTYFEQSDSEYTAWYRVPNNYFPLDISNGK